jgi:hypothetical protein
VAWIAGVAAGLEASPLGAWARGSAVGYPLVNLIHLLGLVLLIAPIGFMDLRLVGLFRHLPAQVIARVTIPSAVAGLALLIPSGFVMFAADAVPLTRSPLFQWKIALIAIALANVALFHLIWGRQLDSWDRRAAIVPRVVAGFSILLWLTIAALGRLIGYA